MNKIEPQAMFDVIRGGPDVYVQSLDYCGKTIGQAEQMLPPGYNIQYQSRREDYADEPESHPDDRQYAVFRDTDPDRVIIHLYVNGDVIDDTLTVT